MEYLYSKHKVSGNAVDAAAEVVNAGLNIRTNFTPPKDFILPLREAIKQGKVSQQTVDSRVRDILRVKFMAFIYE